MTVAPGEQTEQPLVTEVAGRVVERRMECDQVAAAGHLVERQKTQPLALFAGRIAAEDTEAPAFGISLHERPDMPHPHDAEGALFGPPVLPASEVRQHPRHPLQDAAGIAAGGGRDADAAPAAVGKVDMIEADRGRGDQPHGGVAQQLLAAPGPVRTIRASAPSTSRGPISRPGLRIVSAHGSNTPSRNGMASSATIFKDFPICIRFWNQRTNIAIK